MKRLLANGMALFVLIAASTDLAVAGLIVYTSEAQFVAAVGPTLLIDFDTDAGGGAIPHAATIDLQYQAWGLDFNPYNGGNPNTIANAQAPSTFFALSAPNQVRTVPATGGGGGFELVLAQPASGIGLYFGDVEFSGSFLDAFDAGGQLLGSVDVHAVLGNSPLQWKFLGFSSTQAGIATFRVSIASNDYVVFDNLLVASATVPEPSSLSLVIVGGGIVLLARCRRRTGRCSRRRGMTASPDVQAPQPRRC